MKLVSLNIWGGTLYEPLKAFVMRQAADTDIFCFQEIFDTPTDRISMDHGTARPDIYRRFIEVLPEHQSFYAPCQDASQLGGNAPLATFSASVGLGLFVRKGVPIHSIGDAFVLGERNGYIAGRWETLPRNVQYLRTTVGTSPVTIGNFHGIVDKMNGKRDSDIVLTQMKNLIAIMDHYDSRRIIVGDMNVRPDTESIRMFERAGYRNLIGEFAIPLTRNSHYGGLDRYNDTISDYLFATPDIIVTKFEVLPDEVSDHLALMLEFE